MHNGTLLHHSTKTSISITLAITAPLTFTHQGRAKHTNFTTMALLAFVDDVFSHLRFEQVDPHTETYLAS